MQFTFLVAGVLWLLLHFFFVKELSEKHRPQLPSFGAFKRVNDLTMQLSEERDKALAPNQPAPPQQAGPLPPSPGGAGGRGPFPPPSDAAGGVQRGPPSPEMFVAAEEGKPFPQIMPPPEAPPAPVVVYEGQGPERMHGIKIGVGTDGNALWSPEPKPVNQDVRKALAQGGGFNLALSNSISLNRPVSDMRDNLCAGYVEKISATARLPRTSVIFVFFNEPLSTLMRSVHSVFNRTPPELLEEIILVDDGSDIDWIKSVEKGGTGELEKYIREGLPKTRLLRLPERRGLVAARLMGIENAKAETFVILDSHIEVQPGWAEPLMHRLMGEDGRTRVVMPMIDGTDAQTFKHTKGGIGCTLGFIWKVIEHAVPEQQKDLKLRSSAIDPIPSPAMAGGLFAANTKYFLEAGGYDPLFLYWGTENLELLWQCGGSLECSPCSRVFHVFRQGGAGYSIPGNAVTINRMRTTAIWMDELGELARAVLGRPQLDIGALDDRIQMRKEQKCKNFNWFMKEIWPESYVREIADVPFLGMLRNKGQQVCLEPSSGSPGGSVRERPCPSEDYLVSSGAKEHLLANSQRYVDFHRGPAWMYFRNPGHIMPVKNDEACLQHRGSDPTHAKEKDEIYMEWCQQNQQIWEWRPVVPSEGPLTDDANYQEGLLGYKRWHNVQPSQDMCLAVLAEGEMNTRGSSRVAMKKCNAADPSQVWQWERFARDADLGLKLLAGGKQVAPLEMLGGGGQILSGPGAGGPAGSGGGIKPASAGEQIDVFRQRGKPPVS
uniref:Glycosyltransferase 2-like domain-containing protein n=1 Tax=Chromera velia CCMP2878 TaxID=1169474 RepID=A0A0G4IFU8_9ALVE|eukprot:Cvel_2495.t1-p1 / transcript=Cvel_2495.t1 / gene=Cvel_2495 / organism=Chromera_velia_CCMP2878 / gene_product=Polypeptide N-acetylgalactosaminyltransferase 3, putative / transcript_product=Polypeptide N-acetylgalactosaminyltransferase 3, putative / location=Cvel_scaffold98:34575-42447(-) / protein_length=773 / sequence_SO=supercontig / SO=protein_coding / is_pseudo=false